MEQQKIVAQLLVKLADCIEHSSADDLEDLLAGRRSLTILNGSLNHGRVVRRPERTGGAIKRSHASKQLREFMNQLRTLESRDAGMNLLLSAELTRKELEQLARMMDLPVLREDDAQRLRQKLVEASIGSRLNSAAIRGE